MQSTTLLISKLRADHPALQFASDAEFRWDPTTKTVFYEASGDTASLLHELSHALLGHISYARDVELIEMERDAWQHTTTVLAPQYEVRVDEDATEDALDTYRDWLHARSRCPQCQATGVQTRKNTYKCLACLTLWQANDARICALRRYVINKKHTR